MKSKRKAKHHHFWLETAGGNHASILGDPQMSAETKRALGEMVDAVVKAANDGKLISLKKL